MSEIVTKAQLSEKLNQFTSPSQQHLLAFWDDLSELERQHLGQQILNLDSSVISNLIADSVVASDDANVQLADADGQIQFAPPPAFRLDDDAAQFSSQRAKDCGEEAIRSGKLGVILVAGGQGTRLGFEHPKGMYPIGPVSGHTLFQILLERLLAIRRRYGAEIPLYIMTSPATHDETIRYLGEKNRFGLPDRDLKVFCQGTMPAVDRKGRILLASKSSLALSPDGHGGMLAALAGSGCLADARRRGVEHLFYGQVDNPLVQICDPRLVGFHLLSYSEMTTQAVSRAGPSEKVGNLVSVDGSVQIVEYIHFPEDLAKQTNCNDSLTFWAGSIAVHVFDVGFLERMLTYANAMPWNYAKKKTPHIAENGKLLQPESSNATKFERFIFDLLPHAENAIVVEGDRGRVFAPVKNANDEQVDTPKTAQATMIAEHVRWLREAGATVEEGARVEISPLFALDADELSSKIKNDLKVNNDTFFH